MAAKRVLIVPGRWAVAERLRADGHVVVEADSPDEAGDRVDAGVDAVLLDLHMPDRAALAALAAIHERDPDPPVILIAQPDDVEGPVATALAAGAFDYALEPISIDDIARRVLNAFEVTRIRRELRTLRDRLARPFTLASIVGASPAVTFARDLARRVSFADAPVLLTGARGTGKDHLARVVHYTGSRAMGPFLKVQCAGMSEDELDVTLFGREPTAGAAAFLTRGVFDEAHDGSILLDDVGALTPALQSKLLRYLESGSFKRVGDSPEIRVDVRVIAATDHPLDADVAAGVFRGDLYYRLNVLAIELPTLASREGDIPLLVRHFLHQHNRAGAKVVTGITPDAMAALSRYSWPGNIDELRIVLGRALMLTDGPDLDIGDLAGFSQIATARPTAAPVSRDKPFTLPDDGCDLEAVEKSLVLQALERTGGNQTRAAALLGIHRDHVRYRLGKWKKPSP
ncbi:MAG: sigma-54-dependent Fis family transcriptional regulator [Acidobacteria bacterium]|nr:MAG: sigma-54-dependent Fis family transcriptional regulator [Acidobacteriota bacterium]